MEPITIASAAKTARVPEPRDRIYKSECMFSFDTPECADGLYTSLSTWQSYGSAYVEEDYLSHGHPLYLRQRHRRVRKPVQTDMADAHTKLAIGVAGGFDVNTKPYDVHKEYSVVCIPSRQEVRFPNNDLPEQVILSVEAILKHSDAERVEQIEQKWEMDDRIESKYAKDLVQLHNGKIIPKDPKSWQCEESGMKDNLWLNLSTGYIGSGRRNWDGSGGTGAALRHYEQTGNKYPLAVKLGTITAEGADVYSYAADENTEVIDPYLEQHLAHWGIDMKSQEKTDKTILELELDLNESFNFNKITESGSQLKPLSGPGYIGLENLGNSCYMASILQLLFAMPEMKARYLDNSDRIFKSAPINPATDLLAMTAKVAVGLLSDRYAKPIPLYEPPESPDAAPTVLGTPSEDIVSTSVRPFRFKALIGKDHVEFKTSRQQDACEFFQHVIDKLSAAERAEQHRVLRPSEPSGSDFVSIETLFAFELEERLECQQSKKSRYLSHAENVLRLPIPVESAVNRELYDAYEERTKKRQKMQGKSNLEDEEPVKLCVPFDACVNGFSADAHVPDFLSPATGKRGVAVKRTRFKSFPQYLMVQLTRYYVTDDYTQRKLDASVQAPHELDLEHLRAKGPAPDEQLLPDDAPPGTPAEPVADPELVSQLQAMGYSENACKRAALATNNAGAQAAMEWVLEHMGDPDFNDPPVSASASASASAPDTSGVSDEQLGFLTSLGCTEVQARAVLKESNGSVERAADWILSNPGELDAAVARVSENTSVNGTSNAIASSLPGKSHLDGPGKYKLVGFASHIGSNLSCGHYVAHILKDRRFVLYNDDKVAVSQNPPTDLGFVYLYKRVE